jgi:hypothetical protein
MMRLDGLDARIALYADGDTTNDPAGAWALLS